MGARVLAVEDDERILASLALMLGEEGHTVVGCTTAEEALDVLSGAQFDLALVDVMLPGIDGFEFCRQVRRSSDLPIVMLTARSDSHDVVAGLEAGADDYVTKPAVPKELAARIRAVLRRASRVEAPTAPDILRFGRLEVSPEGGFVRVDEHEVGLTRTEFRLLVELAMNADRVLSRESLLERVWGYDYFGDGRLVDVHVRRLRMKIERDPAEPEHVVTVRGLGYKLQS